MKITEFKADLALLLTAFIWGAALLPIVASLKTNDVFTIVFWRFFISAILIGILALKFDKFFDKNALKYGAMLGFTLFLGVSFQTTALKYTYSSSVSFIVALYVVLVPFISWLFFRQKVRIYAYFGIIFGAIGLYLMQKNLQFLLGRGEFFSVCSALALALHIVLMGHFTKKSELFTFLMSQFFVIALCSFIFSLTFRGGVVPNFDTAFINAMLFTIFLSTILGFSIEGLMLRYTTPIKAAIIFIFKPVTAGFLGYFLGGENLTPTQILGACIIVFGILITEFGSYKQKIANKS